MGDVIKFVPRQQTEWSLDELKDGYMSAEDMSTDESDAWEREENRN